jgi:hypothetical protein
MGGRASVSLTERSDSDVLPLQDGRACRAVALAKSDPAASSQRVRTICEKLIRT